MAATDRALHHAGRGQLQFETSPPPRQRSPEKKPRTAALRSRAARAGWRHDGRGDAGMSGRLEPGTQRWIVAAAEHGDSLGRLAFASDAAVCVGHRGVRTGSGTRWSKCGGLAPPDRCAFFSKRLQRATSLATSRAALGTCDALPRAVERPRNGFLSLARAPALGFRKRPEHPRQSQRPRAPNRPTHATRPHTSRRTSL